MFSSNKFNFKFRAKLSLLDSSKFNSKFNITLDTKLRYLGLLDSSKFSPKFNFFFDTKHYPKLTGACSS